MAQDPTGNRRRTWVIGGSTECDLRVRAPYVSGRHCRLTFRDGVWVLEDLGSTNGTFVNGARITAPVRVSRTDRVTLGTSVPMPWPVERRAQTVSTSDILLPSSGGPIVLGRANSCDMVLPFPMISSRHASIERSNGGWLIRDLGSTNGTFVQGKRIVVPTRVGPGDVVNLGSHRLQLSAAGDRLEQRLDATGGLQACDVEVEIEGRPLISEITFVAATGEMVGILGPSGAGKSTLLSVLAGAQPPTKGSITLEGDDLYQHQDEYRGQIGYVPQDDVMHADLTVWQALWYAARLRLPPDFTNDEIRLRLERVIADLGLEGTERLRIGDAARRGISGGQRKRVNIAMELLTDPPVLVLDEPTSGLSSTDAGHVVKLLRGLANKGKTVVLTIHQPNTEILELMNHVAVIAKDASTGNAGRLVWYGPAVPDAVAFFEPPGSPQSVDPDAILRGLGRRSVAEWVEMYRASPRYSQWLVSRVTAPSQSPAAAVRRHTPLPITAFQWWVLVQRMVAVKVADSWNSLVLLAQAPLIAVLIAGVFGGKTRRPLEASVWGEVATSIGMTLFLLALAALWFGCSNAIRELVGERAIYRRDRLAGASPASYLGSKVALLGVTSMVQCGVLIAIVASACRLQGNLATTYGLLVLAASVGVAIGLVVSALARSVEAAAATLPILLLPMVVLGGALLPLPELPPAATFVADALPSRWAFEGLMINEAEARPVLFRPTSSDEGAVVVDLAEPYFPRSQWRTQPGFPAVMLATMWALGSAAAWTILRGRDGRPP
jgi:ABC-type multidrug transport system ATPase subunit/pSer/pThr/pTyr-binding forkhead associated (FHA) protein/ABC-type multidrug transport system permease subunit